MISLVSLLVSLPGPIYVGRKEIPYIFIFDCQEKLHDLHVTMWLITTTVCVVKQRSADEHISVNNIKQDTRAKNIKKIGDDGIKNGSSVVSCWWIILVCWCLITNTKWFFGLGLVLFFSFFPICIMMAEVVVSFHVASPSCALLTYLIWS